jgi:hypothetical protein
MLLLAKPSPGYTAAFTGNPEALSHAKSPNEVQKGQRVQRRETIVSTICKVLSGMISL